ncbi:H-NS histone [Pseudorhodoferax aquiterrae]|uniref:H-NS histone n=1 Tax=Pseudorhodoferax aquiterrae TaxID=747304 RepID=A0ABQ3G444_9BURK|nr:H-NS histone family protein [Pseudorhodoferax aquiterrae]GHC88156.1 H-NS histone [Pseudorhodoferax aquiterrae]
MTPYKELLQQREELDRQIRELRQRDVQGAIEQARAIVSEFELTQDQVFGRTRASVAGTKVDAKYRDPASGATWTGRGKAPRWIADRNREEFLIR